MESQSEFLQPFEKKLRILVELGIYKNEIMLQTGEFKSFCIFKRTPSRRARPSRSTFFPSEDVPNCWMAFFCFFFPDYSPERAVTTEIASDLPRTLWSSVRVVAWPPALHRSPLPLHLRRWHRRTVRSLRWRGRREAIWTESTTMMVVLYWVEWPSS